MLFSASTLVHEARVRAGLSQRELAKRAETSQAVISAYENARRDPTVDQLASILAAAGFELDVRLRPSEQAPLDDLWQASDVSEDDDRLRDRLRLPPTQRLRQMSPLRDFAAKHRGALSRS